MEEPLPDWVKEFTSGAPALIERYNIREQCSLCHFGGQTVIATDTEEDNETVTITRLDQPWEDKVKVKELIKELKMLRILDCDFMLTVF